MTKKQTAQFNEMLEALRTIAGHRKASTTFMTPDQLRKSDEAKFLGFEEVIEMAYDNMRGLAANASKGVKPIKVTPLAPHPRDKEHSSPSYPQTQPGNA